MIITFAIQLTIFPKPIWKIVIAERIFFAIVEKEGSPASCKNQWKSYKARSKLGMINTYSLANHVFAVQIAFEHVFVSKIDGKVIFWQS